MSIADYIIYVGKGMYEGMVGMLDAQPDDKARDHLREGLRLIVRGNAIPKERMRRLATLLSEAASSVAEELKE